MMGLNRRFLQVFVLAALLVSIVHAAPPIQGIGKAHMCEWPYDSCCVNLEYNQDTESGLMWVKEDTKPGAFNEEQSPKAEDFSIIFNATYRRAEYRPELRWFQVQVASASGPVAWDVAMNCNDEGTFVCYELGMIPPVPVDPPGKTSKPQRRGDVQVPNIFEAPLEIHGGNYCSDIHEGGPYDNLWVRYNGKFRQAAYEHDCHQVWEGTKTLDKLKAVRCNF